MLEHFRPLMAMAMLFSLSAQARAELETIADFGGQSAAPYYRLLNPQPTQAQPQPRVQIPQVLSTADMVPVNSQFLSPGAVSPRTINLTGLAAPLFLVGDDEESKSWIRRNSEDLVRLQAIGWAVSVEDKQGLQELRDLAGGLAVLPINADDFAKRLGIQHYPVLVTSTAIEQ